MIGHIDHKYKALLLLCELEDVSSNDNAAWNFCGSNHKSESFLQYGFSYAYWGHSLDKTIYYKVHKYKIFLLCGIENGPWGIS